MINQKGRYVNLDDKMDILKNLKLSAIDISDINSLIGDVYEVKNEEIHLVTKKELDIIFTEHLKNRLIKPISNTPYKRSYICTIVILATYANRLINNGLNKQLATLKSLYSGSKLLSYPIITLNRKITMDEFISRLSDDNFMFCDYLLISKFIDKDFEKKDNLEIEKLRHKFKKRLQKS